MSREPKNTTSDVLEQESYWSALFLQEERLPITPDPADNGQLFTDLQPSANGHAKSETLNWARALQAFEAEQILDLKVIDYNKGGLLVSWEGLQGFVPASQLVDLPNLHIAHQRLQALSEYPDRNLKLKIIEVNPRLNRLVLSQRAATVKGDQRRHLWRQLRDGDVLNGTVTNLTKFGAFVDLGGIEGLVHISELSWSRVTHPSQILRPGQDVTVLILNIQKEDERIALSCKRLKPDPWKTAEARYHPGELVTGTVSNITGFGAFVLLEEELEGLIHISELAEGSFLHPRNVVQSGDEVTALILEVDGHKKRLALSLRNLPEG